VVSLPQIGGLATGRSLDRGTAADTQTADSVRVPPAAADANVRRKRSDVVRSRGGEAIIESRGVQNVELGVSTRTTRRRIVELELKRAANWIQLLTFCVIGSIGYVINLAVYAVLLAGGVSFIAAAVCSFLAAVGNNYTLNRIFTFRKQRGDVVGQAARYLSVSLLALLANLALLAILVDLGVGELPAQGAAIVLVTPVSFLGNKLWSFRVVAT
jgi:putative flippase GtrA